MQAQYLLRLEALLVQNIEVLNKNRISKETHKLIDRKNRVKAERLKLGKA